MFITLPDEVQFILTSLVDAGYLAYIVGGCVRDSLMGIPPKDWDIATSAKPSEIKAVFSHTVDTGIAHGTVTVVLNRCNYEVTTFRIDGEYLDGRHPEKVVFTTDLEEDLSRRDFTMNAIAYNPSTGLEDPFGGIKDIHAKNIRCVGCAHLRFKEDALRMMRAIRFSAQLSFAIDPDTYSAISPLAERLGMVSMERIREELTKILSAQNPEALLLLEEVNLWPQVTRGTYIGSHLRCVAKMLKECPKEPAMLYALFQLNQAFMRHLKFDNRTIKETDLYVRLLNQPITNDRYEIKTILNIMDSRQLSNLLTLKKIIEPEKVSHWEAVQETCGDILRLGECFTIKDLAVSGQDLIKEGIMPGKDMGLIIGELLDMVMADPSLNQKEVLLRLVSQSR